MLLFSIFADFQANGVASFIHFHFGLHEWIEVHLIIALLQDSVFHSESLRIK